MPDDPEDEKRAWIMTAWSCLAAVLITALLFLSISEAHKASARPDGPARAYDRQGQRMLY